MTRCQRGYGAACKAVVRRFESGPRLQCGCSSAGERLVAIQKVEGSIPSSRSSFMPRSERMKEEAHVAPLISPVPCLRGLNPLTWRP